MQGSGFYIFFYKTALSKNENPKAASQVNIFAKIVGDPKIFNQFNSFK